jgi:hypothetical protein
MLSSAAYFYFYLLGPNIPHNTLFSDTHKLCSSFIHIRICAGLDQTLKKINVQSHAGLSSYNPRHLKIKTNQATSTELNAYDVLAQLWLDFEFVTVFRNINEDVDF